MKKKNLNLGVFLSLGDSFRTLKKSGQDIRFLQEYLQRYTKHFNQIDIFSYPFLFPRFLYQFLIPFIHLKKIKKIDIFRVMQLTGTIPAILTRIFWGKPFIFTYGYDYVSFSLLEGQKIRPILLKLLEKLAVKLASGIIVTNKKIQFALKQKYPQVKLFYIPNGVDINKFKIKNEKLKIIINILTVARLEKQKNLDSLVKAVALLKKSYKIKLLFIGQGSLKIQLLKLAKKLTVQLKIIDRVAHNKLPAYYQKANIFCLPSFLEGEPKALLEAMASGLPCLIGEYSGAKEFKNKKEVLLSGFKSEDLADNLKLLLENPVLRKQLGQNAREIITENFNIDKLLTQEIKILQKLAKKPAPTL